MTGDNAENVPLDELPPVCGSDDLLRAWRVVKGPWGFDEPQMFVMLLGGDGVCLHIMNITGCHGGPDGRNIANLYEALENVAESSDVLSVAVMWARPGGGALNVDDLRWARALTEGALASNIVTWPVHVADDHGVKVVAPDDLVA